MGGRVKPPAVPRSPAPASDGPGPAKPKRGLDRLARRALLRAVKSNKRMVIRDGKPEFLGWALERNGARLALAYDVRAVDGGGARGRTLVRELTSAAQAREVRSDFEDRMRVSRDRPHPYAVFTRACDAVTA